MLRALGIFLAAVLAVATPGSAGTLGTLDEEGGFADAKLGAPIESFSGLHLIGRDEAARTETYIRRSDALRVGEAEIDGVTYSFYEGRLYFISMRMTGERNSQALLAELERVYGTGIKTEIRPNETIWPRPQVFVLYDMDPETQRGLAAMTSAPIHAQMKLDRRDSSANASDGL